MSSKRKQIRQKVKEILEADLTTVSTIFETRIDALTDSMNLPCVSIFTKTENYSSLNAATKFLDTDLDLAVEVYVDGTGSIDDELDDITNEIMVSLLAPQNEVVRGLWDFIDIESCEIAYSNEGRKPLGAARMNFKIKYEIEFKY